ncbi:MULTISPECIES: tripartite tricarboxylate transporter substrate binding protein [Halomonadaceae]|uniref:tripartite tricarboxylate transporter substrate binding protein n=1 Tax=Halomonas TaxID=2745 RepID=UPI000ED4CBC4|nr:MULTISPECIES: tripartite tricarboxylate transporter substrate binding protein [Halomonas]HCR96948.1 tripartite tricarboxylate transporter substrate binding protein [Halomonas sp.]
MAYSGRGLARYCITLGFVSGLLLWGTTFTFAENRYPDREITVVIPFGLGGATDVLFRDIFDTAQIYLDQPVLVVNMPGREAMRGAQYVKNASPDGYTLLGSHQTIDLSYLAGLASFSHADFAPVSLLVRTINIPATYAGHAAQQASDIGALVQTSSTPLKFGVIANSTDHLFWLQFFEQSGISLSDVQLVHFPDTASEVEALVAREIDFAMLNLPSAGTLFVSGALVPLAVAGSERLSGLPDVLTLREQGIDLVHTSDRGVFAPAGTPPGELAVLNDALAYALASEPLRHRITHEYGSLIDYRSLSTYRDYLDEQFNELVSLTERVHLGR